MTSNPTRVAVYCRLAQKDDERMEVQKERLLQYALEQGYDDITLYADNGASGLNFDRPGFLQMNKDIDAGLIHAIIIQSLDRIGRNMVETMQWINHVADKGISFKINMDSMEQELFNASLDFFNQFYKVNEAMALGKKGGV